MSYTIEELQEPIVKPVWFDEVLGDGADRLLSEIQSLHDCWMGLGEHARCAQLRDNIKERSG